MTADLVRVDRATDAQRYLATDQTVWFSEVVPTPAEEFLVGLPPEHRFAASVDGADPQTYPGIYGVFPMTLAVPGHSGSTGQVPCAGLTWVGVHPDHRRKGVLTAMLRHHFEQVRDQLGVHLSALHASEPAIYGRHGYGLASVEHEITLGRGTTLSAPDLDQAAAGLSTVLHTVSDPEMPERLRRCHLGVAEPGAVVGEAGYYHRICTDRPETLRDKEPTRVLFARQGGADVGFALFRRTHKWERARPSGELSVLAVVGDPAARIVLLRRLLDFDLIGTVKVHGVADDDPLLLWVGGPRSASDVATYDSLWIRLVNLPEALSARAWSAPCDVVVEVSDAVAPWNDGCWRVSVAADGQATVARSVEPADLRLPVSALGGAYVGGGNLVALQRAGLVQEQRPGSVAELWRALRTDVAPSAAFGF